MRHRIFNADRFLDKFEGNEAILQHFVASFDGHNPHRYKTLDVPQFKELLVNGALPEKDELLEALYRAYDVSSERGHEDIVGACRELGYDPDPQNTLPVECLSLKVLAENSEAFDFAYDRHALWKAERFTIYGGQAGKSIDDCDQSAQRLQERLSDVFKQDKNSDRVLIRHYREGAYVNFIVYHEKRTESKLIFKGTRTRLKVSPTVLRPAQQDFISYNQNTGQVEIEARFAGEEDILRKSFAECCLGQADFFEGPDSVNRFNLDRIADPDFSMPADEGHVVALAELHFRLNQKHNPSFSVRSRNTLETLDLNDLRDKIEGTTIRKAVFKMQFPDDARGKRVELVGTNQIRFNRATHAEDVFRYLKNWTILLA